MGKVAIFFAPVDPQIFLPCEHGAALLADWPVLGGALSVPLPDGVVVAVVAAFDLP